MAENRFRRTEFKVKDVIPEPNAGANIASILIKRRAGLTTWVHAKEALVEFGNSPPDHRAQTPTLHNPK